LAFSCRERARSSHQKINDLAREAVGCNAGLGRSRIGFVLFGHRKRTISNDAITPGYGANVLF
jgi:hypothetical protein